MNNTFYETYAENYKTKSLFSRFEALNHWIDCYKRDIKNEYDNTHSAKMLACIMLAEYELGKAGK